MLPMVRHKYDPEVLNAAYTFLSYVPMSIFTMTLFGILNGRYRGLSFQGMRVPVIATAAVLLAGFVIFGELPLQETIWAYLGAQAIAGLWSIWLVGQEDLRPPRSTAMSWRVLRYRLLSHSGSV